MKKFSTSYICSGLKFCSHIYAVDYTQAELFTIYRGLNETIEGIIYEDDNKLIHLNLPSYMFAKNKNPFYVLHGVCWFENIKNNIETLRDDGLLHDLIHFYEKSSLTETQFSSREDIYNSLVALELSVLGLLPSNYQHFSFQDLQ
jgi:hypothetical protein